MISLIYSWHEYSTTGMFILAPMGRQRCAQALNAITHELVMVTNDTYITANTVCELLRPNGRFAVLQRREKCLIKCINLYLYRFPQDTKERLSIFFWILLD